MDRVAIENPVMHRHARDASDLPKPQIIATVVVPASRFQAMGFTAAFRPATTNRLAPPAPGTDDLKRWSAGPPRQPRTDLYSRSHCLRRRGRSLRRPMGRTRGFCHIHQLGRPAMPGDISFDQPLLSRRTSLRCGDIIVGAVFPPAGSNRAATRGHSACSRAGSATATVAQRQKIGRAATT